MATESQPAAATVHASGGLVAGQLVGNGRYSLLWMLGCGGTCMVWLAQDERLSETVALKFLMPEAAADPAMIKELRKEALRSRRLAHQNIVQLYDLNEFPAELPFLIMEYVEGASLHTRRLETPGQFLTWDILQPLTQQLCHALDHAHGEGLIHRDLKPANIMVDTKGRAKLADFGISGTMNDAYTRILGLRDTRGTMTFMSPQQMDGDPPQITDDIYSFGATLYELLTSRAPFFTGDIEHQVRQVPPQPVAACLRELKIENPVPANVSSLILACLRKQPDQRPQSMAEVAERLFGPDGAHLPLSETPRLTPEGDPTAPYAPRQRFSREFFIVMAVLLLLLVLALVTLVIQMRG